MVKGRFVAKIQIDFNIDRKVNSEELKPFCDFVRNQCKYGIKEMIEDGMKDFSNIKSYKVTILPEYTDVVQV